MIALIVFIVLGAMALTSSVIFLYCDKRDTNDYSSHIALSLAALALFGTLTAGATVVLGAKRDTCIEKHLNVFDVAGETDPTFLWICTAHRAEKETK